MKMAKAPEIPCSCCLLWDKEKKSFSCDPNKCEKLSYWLLKHAHGSAGDLQNNVQYVV
jgi:hypothetical protein